jgi:hypothetical protein
MKNFLPAVLLALCTLTPASSQTTNNAASPSTPEKQQELLIQQLKETVVFLRADTSKNLPVNGICHSGVPDPLQGTGFFIRYATPELGPGNAVPLLVTARHMIRESRFYGKGPYVPKITMRFNLLQPDNLGRYSAETQLEIVDKTGKLRAFVSDDESVLHCCLLCSTTKN